MRRKKRVKVSKVENPELKTKKIKVKKEKDDLQSGDIRKIEHLLKVRVAGPGG